MRQLILFLALACAGLTQAQSPKSFVGTVTGFRPEIAQIEIRPDTGEVVIATVTPDSLAQKIAPGARDLKSAQPVKVTDVALGDRVLVTLEPGTQNLRRIVVMPAQDIAQHNEAERRDWDVHGISGIVSAKSGNRITLKTRTAAGDAEGVVTLEDKTTFKRYAPDSVKFADARPSSQAELAMGDQLRARGEKSEDGRHVAAREVVFGAFLVKAGTIVAVNPESREIAIKELGTGKPLTIVITADSQVKQMPSFPMMGAAGRGTPPTGGRAGGGGMPGGRGPGGATCTPQALFVDCHRNPLAWAILRHHFALWAVHRQPSLSRSGIGSTCRRSEGILTSAYRTRPGRSPAD